MKRRGTLKITILIEKTSKKPKTFSESIKKTKLRTKSQIPDKDVINKYCDKEIIAGWLHQKLTRTAYTLHLKHKIENINLRLKHLYIQEEQ